jgi:hypothetical protein
MELIVKLRDYSSNVHVYTSSRPGQAVHAGILTMVVRVTIYPMSTLPLLCVKCNQPGLVF